jgi:hypothetical protein
MTTLFVTNNWDKTIEFDYAFKLYQFPVGKSVEIPEGAARHLFGHGDADKEPYLVRLGLIKTKADIPEGIRILSKISITEELPVKNHSLSPVVEKVPLPANKRAAGNFKQPSR